MLKEKLYDLFCNMDDEDIVYIWNEYCNTTYMFDDEIYTADGLEELIIMKTPFIGLIVSFTDTMNITKTGLQIPIETSLLLTDTAI